MVFSGLEILQFLTCTKPTTTCWPVLLLRLGLSRGAFINHVEKSYKLVLKWSKNCPNVVKNLVGIVEILPKWSKILKQNGDER